VHLGLCPNDCHEKQVTEGVVQDQIVGHNSVYDGLVELLESAVMPYAWGSRVFLAKLRGRPTPAAGPEAELWMGAHPLAPSKLTRAGRARSLLELVQADPERELGAETAARYGRRLPFLLKVLAADEPLSIQAHPSAEQAREGFAREESSGVPLTAANRTYKDASHKPELLVALEPFDALCGFRTARELLELLDVLAVPELATHRDTLRASPDADGLHAVFTDLLATPPDARAALVRATARACGRCSHERFRAITSWVVRLAERHPNDAGVACALMLEHVRLEKDEALYLPAGNLHAYLHGAGVEIMASSDNVLRGGLTTKHVDVAELARVVRFDAPPTQVLRPRALNDREAVWDTPAEEFRLSRVDVARAHAYEARPLGPEVLLCVEGSVVAAGDETVTLSPGDASFVRGSEKPYALTGEGSVFRAAVGSTFRDGTMPPTRGLG
jgi:mannose-6-phosphate isomerase